MKRVRHARNQHRLVEYRQKNRLTQAEFAALIGVTHSTISLLEAGKLKPNAWHMEKITQVTKGFLKLEHFNNG